MTLRDDRISSASQSSPSNHHIAGRMHRAARWRGRLRRRRCSCGCAARRDAQHRTQRVAKHNNTNVTARRCRSPTWTTCFPAGGMRLPPTTGAPRRGRRRTRQRAVDGAYGSDDQSDNAKHEETGLSELAGGLDLPSVEATLHMYCHATVRCNSVTMTTMGTHSSW
jgi:hypothetical protein